MVENVPTQDDPRLNFLRSATLPSNPEVAEARDKQDLFGYFALLMRVHDPLSTDEEVSQRAEGRAEQYLLDVEEGGDQAARWGKVLVIKDDTGYVVAGGRMIVVASVSDPKVLEAFLRSKVVHPSLRRQNLGHLLSVGRLNMARGLGIKKAFCWVATDNYPALASAFKDGFVITADPRPGMAKELYDDIPVWYMEKGLKKDHDEHLPEQRLDESRTIALNETDVIKTLLNQGYVGVRVAVDDTSEARSPVLYLEKTSQVLS